MRILIVADKFKGTLTARQACQAIARGWKRVRSDDASDLLPMSDGGDGFGDVMSMLLGARVRRVQTVDAAHRPLRARWWWESNSRTAIIESAEVIGLAKLPAKRFHPFELDTFGLGRMLAAAARMKPRRCIVGIGGSATNDGGFGMARALGWRFVAPGGDEITAWPDLAACREIIPPEHHLKLGRLTVALDVQNPLLGANGSTRVYGPQKGIGSMDFKKAEAALRRMAMLADQDRSSTLATTSGAGAAGGLGFGLMTFLGAKPAAGFSLFAREAGLDKRIRTADLVITGEGSFDAQSLMGKGVGQLADLCRKRRVPCIVIAGSARTTSESETTLAGVYSLEQLTSRARALGEAGFWLSEATAKAAAAYLGA